MIITKLHSSAAVIDFQAQQLTFLDQRFYRTESGAFVPSVTTILEAYPKTPDYYAWLKKMGDEADTVRDDAGRRGSTVHQLTERYDVGEEINLLDDGGFIGYSTLEWSMLARYAEFIEKHQPTIVHSELNVVSETLGCAGTLDRTMIIADKTYLVDIKTSNSIYPSYWLQLAAYKQLLAEAQGFDTIDEVAILWLNAKTRTDGKKGAIQGAGWQLITRTSEETAKDWQLFCATRQLWMAQNEGTQPRQMTYKLSIRKPNK